MSHRSEARELPAGGAGAAPAGPSQGERPPVDWLRELHRSELLDHVPPLYIADLQGRVLWSNPAFAALERSLVRARGSGGGGVLPLAEIAAEVAALRAAVFRDEAVRMGDTIQRLRSRHVPLRDETGQIGAIAGIVQPVADESHRLEALALMRERLDDITRLVSDWIWETDPNLTITSVSPRVAQALSFHPRELIGRNLLSLGGADPGRAALQQRFQRNTPFRDMPFAALTKFGEKRYFMLSAVPVFSSSTGALVGFRGTASDITELKKREMSLRAAKEMAETASRAKTEFLANVSHELRTPLNAIIGFSEIMDMELLGPIGNSQYQGYISDIHASAQHLLGVINDILDVAKIEAGKAELQESEFNLTRLFDSVFRLIRERAARAGLTLVVHDVSGLPPVVADEQKLKQILINLLSNAVKFTPAGGRIELGARIDENGDLLITTTDTGIGIAPSDIERVMEPFGQADSHLNRKYQGTGLGLPLARGLTELHGGRLVLESRLNVGTTVTVVLPRHRLRLPDTPAAETEAGADADPAPPE
ncbi:MAG: PAS domain-containing sensor histidine kinase, partial [Rhodospirillaceae bacterium]|nr:PAS domain-containing sensor histidine kinase [Rhodospirillaceae bacterium]